MRRKLLGQIILVALMVLLIGGCAAWDALTPDEKARTVVDGLQDQVGDMWKASKQYLALHPEYQEKWKAEIVPAFDLANKALKEVTVLASMELITPEEVRSRIMPLIMDVIRYLGEIGFYD